MEVYLKQSHQKELTADAKIIYQLHLHKKLSFKKLAEKAKVHRSTLYRILPVMLKEGCVKEITGKKVPKLSEGVYALSDYEPVEKVVRRLLDLYMSLYMLSVDYDSLIHLSELGELILHGTAIQVGEDPHNKNFRKQVYKTIADYLKEFPNTHPEVYKRMLKTLEKKINDLRTLR